MSWSVLRTGSIDTPIGEMIATVDGNGAIVRLGFADDATTATARSAAASRMTRDDDGIDHVRKQLDAYFAGRRRVFDLSLAPPGNAFLLAAWSHLALVPYGSTVTYGQLARRMTPPTSARAMGRANAVNPISIVVPCHRVIGADGTLTGYSGGLERKAALLRLEEAAGPMLLR